MVLKKSRALELNSVYKDSILGKEDVGQDSPVDEAFRKIKEMMYRHEIVPGQRLIYQELAEKLGMSVTPIVQALNRLQVLNLVITERNKGYYVGKSTPTEAKELFMVREALETFLIPSVIEKLTDDKLRVIERAINAHTTAISAPHYRRALLVIDTNFHLTIIQSAENRVFYILGRLILEQIYLKYRPEYMHEERLKEAAREHREILNALRARDVKSARRLLKTHIRNGSKHIVGSLFEDIASGP